jgi:hypothetical protein
MDPRKAAVLCLALLAACSRSSDEEGKRRVFSREERAPEQAAAPARFDPSRPYDALALSAGDVAHRLGSFEWTAGVDWTVAREGDDATRVHALERHHLRQAASGDFDLDADLDPGQGPGSETGKSIVWTGGMTYARAKHAPFRERPTDHGRDARRFRDESFRMARAIVDLYGPALELVSDGEATVLGRTVRRYRVALAPGKAPAPVKHAAAAPDADTSRRFAFLEGKEPASADGELDLDATTGAPLRVRLAGTFTVRDSPGVKASVELVAQVKAIGEKVAVIAPPAKALPDDRKPPGVAGALEAAGLKKAEGAAAGEREGEGEAEEK